MFCGSCMQDNTLARTLRLADEDAVLVPTYTPIRVDEDDVSVHQVFLGGINVYLDSKVPGWKRLPSWTTGWLNKPAVIRWLTRFGTSTDAAHLGGLTLDMLKGTHGPQRREIETFVDFLCTELRPDVIVFSNALLSGVLPALRDRFSSSILCLLQGDDIFLEGLTDRWKGSVLQLLKQNCRMFDGFLTHSRYYRDFMSQYLDLSPDHFRHIPLTIDAVAVRQQFPSGTSSKESQHAFTIGYFARICPEKGIQNLLEAAAQVLPDFPSSQLSVGGFLPQEHHRWFEGLCSQFRKTCPNQLTLLGSPAERNVKFELINQFDVLCVPTNYHEPKGIYVLEAGLLGVPSVVPNHGAFPELVDALDHGMLYDSGSVASLAETLRSMLQAGPQRQQELADRVEERFGMAATAPIVKSAILSFAQ